MQSLIATFLLGLCILSLCLRDGTPSFVSFPASFSNSDKLKTENTIETFQELLFQLSTYEIDSHIEVVLVGNSFTDAIVRELETVLAHLSRTSAANSPLKFAREKLIYHATSQQSLTQNMNTLIKGSSDRKVHPQAVERMLADYHLRAHTTTTLFVVLMNINNAADTYSYVTHAHGAKCRRNTFISAAGFAWMDLTAEIDQISPQYAHRSLPTVEYFYADTISKEIDRLATVIHRSGESLHAFPLPGSLHVRGDSLMESFRKSFSQETVSRKVVHVIQFNICGDLLAIKEEEVVKCAADSVVNKAVQRIVNTVSRYTSVHFTTVDLTLNDPQVAHAVHSALRYVPSSDDFLRFDAREMLYWLGASAHIKDIIAKAHTETPAVPADVVEILPMFNLQLPSVFQALFDNNDYVIESHFQEPPGGWGVSRTTNRHKGATVEEAQADADAEDATRLALTMSWPRRAILFASPLEEKAFGKTEKISSVHGLSTSIGNRVYDRVQQNTGLVCTGEGSIQQVTITNETVSEELWLTLREAIWDVSPPYVHYSSAADEVVLDYLWYEPPSLTPPALPQASPSASGTKAGIDDSALALSIKEEFSRRGHNALDKIDKIPVLENFRDSRAVYRRVLFTRAEYLLDRFASAIQSADLVVPAINITTLLDLRTDESAEKDAQMRDAGSLEAMLFEKGPSSGAKSKRNSASKSKVMRSPRSAAEAPVGLLHAFLVCMDEASTKISHLEFESAYTFLSAATIHVMALERRIKAIIAHRTGDVVCRTGTDTPTDRSREAKNDASWEWTKGALTYVSILVGVSVGLVRAAYLLAFKPRSKSKY